MSAPPPRHDWVGPVLERGAAADAVIAAIRARHPDVHVVDRGSYLRVLVPRECNVTRREIEAQGAAPFELPGDLERIMPSFKGKLALDGERVRWSSEVVR